MLSPIGDLISPIGNILHDWELGIFFFGSVVMTQKFPIANFINIPNRAFYISDWRYYGSHSEILAIETLTLIRNLSPGLENIHSLNCCSDNFPTTPYMSVVLQNCQNYISLNQCFSIQGTRS